MYDFELYEKKANAGFDVLGHKMELAVIEMRDGMAHITSCVDKMWWRIFWSFFMMMVMQFAMFAVLWSYMHECIRVNADRVTSKTDNEIMVDGLLSLWDVIKHLNHGALMYVYNLTP